MSEHRLKTWPDYWNAVASGAKNFEVRHDDRGFQKGDVVILQKFDPKTQAFVMDGTSRASRPREIRRRVSYILTGGHFGIEAGFVVMGLEVINCAE